jgi:hypothetical protein
MKRNFYVNFDILSSRKVRKEDLEGILSRIEAGVKETDLLNKIIDFFDVNFQGYLVLSTDEVVLENDLSDQIQDTLDVIESTLPGGCALDSRADFYSDYHPNTDTWYKEKSGWVFTQEENENSSFRIPDWGSDFDGIDGNDDEIYW